MSRIYDNKKSLEQSEIQTISRRIYFGLIIALVIIIGGSFIFVSHFYNEGIEHISQREYEEAIESLNNIKYTQYRGKKIKYIIALCESHLAYKQDDNLWKACSLMVGILNKNDFNYQNDEILEKDITQFVNILAYQEKRIEAENERRVKAELSNELPYEGLNEEYINYTSLGHYTTKEEKEYYTAYAWYENDIEDSKHLLCRVRVVRKELSTERYVSEVHLYGDLNPSSPSYSSKPNSSSDNYDIDDYGDPEDFYYENYDDFLDYYDAEDYYYEHKKR